MKALAKVVALLLIACSVAQTTQKLLFRDNKRDMQVFAKSWSAQFLEDSRMSFKAEGIPVKAIWEISGRTLQAQSITGIASRGTDNNYVLDTATLTGNAYVKEIKASESDEKDAKMTTELTAASATYTHSNERWVLKGGITGARNDSAKGREVSIKGDSGSLDLYGEAKPKTTHFPFKSGTVMGNVTFHSTSRRTTVDAKTKAKKTVTYIVDGTADKIEFDDAEGTATLTGDVHVTGTDPRIGGDVFGDTIVITFDLDGQPIKIEGSGSPGTTILTKKPPTRRSA